MIIIRIAELNIKINNKYPFIEKQCIKYYTDNTNIDFEIDISTDDIDAERKLSTENFSDGYLESICTYRKIALILPNYDCFLMHGAIISVDNKGFGFCAKSGTGKTTHIRLWKKLLGDKLVYVNGDKPIIRLKNNIPYAYGTPWCGKENYNNNICVPLTAIGFINRSQINYINELPRNQIISKMVHQILLPKDYETVSKTLNLLNETFKYTKVFDIYCNMDIEAAIVSYNEMMKDE